MLKLKHQDLYKQDLAVKTHWSKSKNQGIMKIKISSSQTATPASVPTLVPTLNPTAVAAVRFPGKLLTERYGFPPTNEQ